MSKIVFINPSVDKYAEIKLWASDLLDDLNKRSITVMPKMAPLIMAALTPEKHTYIYLDEEIEDIDFDHTDADLVAITAMTIQADRAYEIADEFRRRGIKVVMGGIHVSVRPDEVAQHVDAICIGEGENIWPKLLEDLERGQLKARYEAKDYPPVENLVRPRVDVIDHEGYSMYPVMTTKGCPYDCDFCSIKFSSGHKIRMKPIEQVVNEIRDLEAYNKGVFRKSYQFVDDNLYINRSYSMKLFTAIRDLNITWHGQGTLNTALDDEVLTLMAESGCRSYSIGFESISEASLKEANKTKSNKVEEYKQAVDNLTRHGIIPAGFFIFGFDSDDRTVFERTLDFVVNTHILNPLFSILTPYPGTRVYERVEHRIFDRKWANYGAVKCVFTPEKMTAEELNAGSYWVSSEIADMKNIRRQLEYFWGQGPWKNNPRLKFRERSIIRTIARRIQNPEYKEFLRWAAKQKNAVDMFMIISAMVFNDMARKSLSKGWNPATEEDRAKDAAKLPAAEEAPAKNQAEG